MKYRLEATRVPAAADAATVVPHSLGLTCNTTTVQATTQSLAGSPAIQEPVTPPDRCDDGGAP